ncbi:MAG: T9SS type A sorting domain-containing protein [Bacteroidota bacterium]|nr:T9SS type A sorting domain-containing protein [Bacteroidota bacterium]
MFNKINPHAIFTLLFLLFIIDSFGQVSVIMNHNDLKRTGWNSNETILSTDNVSSGNFGKIFSRDVDDQIYAQPLVLSHISIGGGTHNIVLVATVNNSVYAFDADDASLSTPYWKVNLTYNSANYRPVKNKDFPNACTFLPQGYSDFTGNIGIVGTPAVDLSTNTIYVVARSKSKTASVFVQYLHAIDVTTGTEKPGSPVSINATYPGTGDGSNGGLISFEHQTQNQRPGLLLYNGIVYICWSSHCDLSPYHGWIIGYDASTLQQKYIYNDTPNGGLGGIWMSGQPPSVDDDGNLFITTGNGTVGQNSDPNDKTNRGNSLIKLSPSLKVLDFFTPMNYHYLNQHDEDYGSDGALLIPGTDLSLSGSKEGKLYLIDNNNMGGFTTDNSNVLQTLQLASTETPAVKNVHGTPVYYKDEYGNEYIYGWAEESLLHQYPFNRTTMLFDTLNMKIGNTALPDGMPGAILSVSSNGSQHGTGILWASHPINGNANWYDVPGVLQAFDATDVTHELWNSNWNSKRDSIGIFAKFVPPTIANGKVYMATFSKKLNVYGLNPPPASLCSNTLHQTWQSADIGYVAYPGDVCVNNGVYTISSSGSDIWGRADAFHYLFQQVITDETELTLRVVSIKNTDPNAKCGIMFRKNLDPGSPYVFLSLVPSNKIYLQQRTAQSTNSFNVESPVTETAPYWLRIYNKGNNYVSYISPDGNNWTSIGSVTFSLGTNPYVGMAYTTHNNSVLDTAIVDNVYFKASGALGVNLINFKGRNQDNKNALLSWTTTGEINNDRFEIQRSGPNTDFKTKGTVQGNGTTSKTHNYFFTDNFPEDGNNYYRLREVDINGTFSYSPVVLVRFNFKKITIYPNPAHDKIYIRNNDNFSKGKIINVQLMDFNGKVLFKKQFQTNGVNIITFNIPAKIINGIYILMVTNSDGEKQGDKFFINR